MYEKQSQNPPPREYEGIIKVDVKPGTQLKNLRKKLKDISVGALYILAKKEESGETTYYAYDHFQRKKKSFNELTVVDASNINPSPIKEIYKNKQIRPFLEESISEIASLEINQDTINFINQYGYPNTYFQRMQQGAFYGLPIGMGIGMVGGGVAGGFAAVAIAIFFLSSAIPGVIIPIFVAGFLVLGLCGGMGGTIGSVLGAAGGTLLGALYHYCEKPSQQPELQHQLENKNLSLLQDNSQPLPEVESTPVFNSPLAPPTINRNADEDVFTWEEFSKAVLHR